MTIKEALEASVHIQLTDKLLDKALIDAGLDGALTYSIQDVANVDEAAIELLIAVMSMKTVSEGSYSVTIDQEAVIKRLLILATKYNRTDLIALLSPENAPLRPRVSNGTNLW